MIVLIPMISMKTTTSVLQLIQVQNNIEAKNYMPFAWLPLSTMHDYSYALCINDGKNIKQTTIMLNNVSAQDRAANVMLFA